MEQLREILEGFLNMPIDRSDGVLEAFAKLPGAIYGKGQDPLQRPIHLSS